MRKLIIALCAVVSVMSCSKDEGDGGYVVAQSMGDIISRGSEGLRVLTDGLDTVIVTNGANWSGTDGNVIGVRVYLSGELISERKSGEHKVYEVRASGLLEVLTKNPLLKSVLDATEGEQEKVGNDRISITQANLSEKYVNISYSYYREDEVTKHFINLVVDDSQTVIDGENMTVYAELRHNKEGDGERYVANGIVSFRVNYLSTLESEPTPKINNIKMYIKYKEGSSTVGEKLVEWKRNVSESEPSYSLLDVNSTVR